MNRVTLKQEHIDLLEMGTVIKTQGVTYYYFPYWVEKGIDGDYVLHSPERIPSDLKRILEKEREG